MTICFRILLASALLSAEAYSYARTLSPSFTDNDVKRPQIQAKLREVMHGLEQPTAVVFVIGHKDHAFVLQKTGRMLWYDLNKHSKVTAHDFKVRTRSEMGLLGMAVHPQFPSDDRVFVHYNPEDTKGMTSRIVSFQLSFAKNAPTLANEKTILEVEQPYGNHDGGHLAFGPDGMLYIGLGDGGASDDPHGAGQRLDTLLGKMLRIDVNARKSAYAIPSDNPFTKQSNARPEIWAYGLRNPWRYAFAPGGQLIAADVGQNAWEEVTLVGKGENHGWRHFEGKNCYLDKPGCSKIKHTPPRIVYGRLDGASITGGYVYQGSNKLLKDHYIFGDFTSGRIWAIGLEKLLGKGPIDAGEMIALGRWPINISSFAQDHNRGTYVLDFSGGGVYALE